MDPLTRNNQEALRATGGMWVALVTVMCNQHQTHKLWLISEDDDTAWAEAEFLREEWSVWDTEVVLFRADRTFRPWGPRLPGGSRK